MPIALFEDKIKIYEHDFHYCLNNSKKLSIKWEKIHMKKHL